jgi:hypothetical protein
MVRGNAFFGNTIEFAFLVHFSTLEKTLLRRFVPG